jgi:hypothetical protein
MIRAAENMIETDMRARSLSRQLGRAHIPRRELQSSKRHGAACRRSS